MKTMALFISLFLITNCGGKIEFEQILALEKKCMEIVKKQQGRSEFSVAILCWCLVEEKLHYKQCLKKATE